MIIPNSITAIPQFMCDGCSGLQRVDLPQTITSIGSYAFRDCGSLTSIEIPNSVTRIYDYAFSKCQNMTSVICYALTPPTAGYFFSKDDTTLYQQSTLSVPAEALAILKKINFETKGYICNASSDSSHFAFLHFFSIGMVLIPVSYIMS